MTEASQHHDFRTVWVKGRQFARTGLGLKRRVYSPPDDETILIAEWTEALADQFAAVKVDEPNPSDSFHFCWPPSVHELDPPGDDEIMYAFPRQTNYPSKEP